MLGLTFLRMNSSRSLTKNENDFACNIGPPLFPNTSYDATHTEGMGGKSMREGEGGKRREG